MKQSIHLFIILILFIGCTPSSTENDADLSEVVKAKGYYFEGDKKYKIYNGGIFRLNEVEDFKNLFPQSTIDGVSNRIEVSNLPTFFNSNNIIARCQGF